MRAPVQRCERGKAFASHVMQLGRSVCPLSRRAVPVPMRCSSNDGRLDVFAAREGAGMGASDAWMLRWCCHCEPHVSAPTFPGALHKRVLLSS